MNYKFDQVTVEDDTKILFSEITTFGDVDVRYEKWFWDGLYAESLIFFNEDIKGIEPDVLKQQIQNSTLAAPATQITVKQTELYTWFNFNFTDEP